MTTNNKIDLNTCVPGQKLELRNGDIVEYVRKLEFDCTYPHVINESEYTDNINESEYTDNGRYFTDKEDSWDVVNILPMEKPKPEIDLNTCVPGQKVKLRDGNIVEYTEPIKNCKRYTHKINAGDIYKDNGSYWHDDRMSDLDVIEILPLEKESKPVTDLRTCVPGQKVKLRDGRIVTYKRETGSPAYPHQTYGGGTYTDEGYYWLDKAGSDNDVMEILPIEEEPAKTSTELTHSITDQIDVTSPDHVSIIPHEHGVTISIKKGNTTINWRHSNS